MLSQNVRNRRLRRLGNVRESWNEKGEVEPGSAKMGSGIDYFVAADSKCVRMKTPGASLQLDREATRVQPGNSLKFQIHHARVGFDQWYFNPLITQPSTAVLPIPTLVPCMPSNDPDIQVLAGVFGALESLREVL
jgi:hypothetical protein